MKRNQQTQQQSKQKRSYTKTCISIHTFRENNEDCHVVTILVVTLTMDSPGSLVDDQSIYHGSPLFSCLADIRHHNEQRTTPNLLNMTGLNPNHQEPMVAIISHDLPGSTTIDHHCWVSATTRKWSCWTIANHFKPATFCGLIIIGH